MPGASKKVFALTVLIAVLNGSLASAKNFQLVAESEYSSWASSRQNAYITALRNGIFSLEQNLNKKGLQKFSQSWQFSFFSEAIAEVKESSTCAVGGAQVSRDPINNLCRTNGPERQCKLDNGRSGFKCGKIYRETCVKKDVKKLSELCHDSLSNLNLNAEEYATARVEINGIIDRLCNNPENSESDGCRQLELSLAQIERNSSALTSDLNGPATAQSPPSGPLAPSPGYSRHYACEGFPKQMGAVNFFHKYGRSNDFHSPSLANATFEFSADPKVILIRTPAPFELSLNTKGQICGRALKQPSANSREARLVAAINLRGSLLQNQGALPEGALIEGHHLPFVRGLNELAELNVGACRDAKIQWENLLRQTDSQFGVEYQRLQRFSYLRRRLEDKIGKYQDFQFLESKVQEEFLENVSSDRRQNKFWWNECKVVFNELTCASRDKLTKAYDELSRNANSAADSTQSAPVRFREFVRTQLPSVRLGANSNLNSNFEACFNTAQKEWNSWLDKNASAIVCPYGANNSQFAQLLASFDIKEFTAHNGRSTIEISPKPSGTAATPTMRVQWSEDGQYRYVDAVTRNRGTNWDIVGFRGCSSSTVQTAPAPGGATGSIN